MATLTIYGLDNSEATKYARHYFRDHDGSVRYVNLGIQGLDGVELQRFLWSFRLMDLIDTDGDSYRTLAGDRSSVPAGELMSRIGRTPGLLRLPLVRRGGRLAVGDDEDAWDRIAIGISSKG